MRFLLPPLGFLLLACGGMLGVFVPDTPVTMPSDTRTFTGRVDESGGVSTTLVRGITESTDVATLRRHLHDQLVSDDWVLAVDPSPGTEPVVLTGRKGDASIDITLESRSGGGASFEVVWVRGGQGG